MHRFSAIAALSVVLFTAPAHGQAPTTTTTSSPTPIQRAASGRDPLNRCAALPLMLHEVPYHAVDLDQDGWTDRLLELPGSCATLACTWRVYRRCPGGGHRLLIEIIALAVEPTTGGSDGGWTDLLATVPAPSNQPQAWVLRYDGNLYNEHAPAPVAGD